MTGNTFSKLFKPEDGRVTFLKHGKKGNADFYTPPKKSFKNEREVEAFSNQ